MSGAATPLPSLTFRLLTQGAINHFSPRLGVATITRGQPQDPSSTTIQVQTPGLLGCTSRGVVPHLSRDNVKITPALTWIHVPFESFLEATPPLPTRQPGTNPLHTFLGFPHARHIVSLSMRDPSDGKDMPVNGNNYLCCSNVRGVQKVTPSDFQSYITALQPDVVIALSDIPFIPRDSLTRKRFTKSIERSLSWLGSAIKVSPTNVIVHMVGAATLAAREAFATALREPIIKERQGLEHLSCLDEAVSGYAFNLLPMRDALEPADQHKHELLVPLFHSSLQSLPPTKLRMVHTTISPHEILHLVRDVGIDLFDSQWAQTAADRGVALDFVFPAPPEPQQQLQPMCYNLYDESFALDFSPLTSHPSISSWPNSPIHTPDRILHSELDSTQYSEAEKADIQGGPFTRAYIHHLLHTHEMSSHALLAMHNLALLDAFFAGIRNVLEQDSDGKTFAREVERFVQYYDTPGNVLEAASRTWKEVDLARGKGRFARERAEEATG